MAVLLVLLLLGAVPAGCRDEEPVDPGRSVAETLAGGVESPELGALLPEDREVAPDALLVEDVVVGEGAPAVTGRRLTAHVVMLRWSDGGVVRDSWARGAPLRVALGANALIPGLEQGLPGMRVGGRRVLTVPAGLAYGERGVEDVIPPDEPLLVVVDLLDVDDHVPAAPIPEGPT